MPILAGQAGQAIEAASRSVGARHRLHGRRQVPCLGRAADQGTSTRNQRHRKRRPDRHWPLHARNRRRHLRTGNRRGPLRTHNRRRSLRARSRHRSLFTGNRHRPFRRSLQPRSRRWARHRCSQLTAPPERRCRRLLALHRRLRCWPPGSHRRLRRPRARRRAPRRRLRRWPPMPRRQGRRLHPHLRASYRRRRWRLLASHRRLRWSLSRRFACHRRLRWPLPRRFACHRRLRRWPLVPDRRLRRSRSRRSASDRRLRRCSLPRLRPQLRGLGIMLRRCRHVGLGSGRTTAAIRNRRRGLRVWRLLRHLPALDQGAHHVFLDEKRALWRACSHSSCRAGNSVEPTATWRITARFPCMLPGTRNRPLEGADVTTETGREVTPALR